MKILIIDDEKDILDSIENILSKEGYEVDRAGSLVDGKAKINGSHYDLVISDIMLPYWGGFDLVDIIKENPLTKKTPVIVMTGMDKDILESTRTFADVCLSKPFTGKQLLEAVRSVIKPG